MADKNGIPAEVLPAFNQILAGFTLLMDLDKSFDLNTPEGRFLSNVADAIEKFEKEVIDL